MKNPAPYQSTENDPPTVFPKRLRIGECSMSLGGMTLRDWFAGQTLVGMLYHGEGFENEDAAAEWAYRQSDAMMRARGA